MYSIGIDIGGTFTDFTVHDHRSDRVFLEKILSTPDEPARAVLSGLDTLAKRIPDLLSGCDRIDHATTLVTNAILERKGAPTALLTTAGFRDVLEMRRELRYNVYDLFARFPEPIVPRRFRYDVTERIYSDGSIGMPLDEAQLERALEEIRAAGIRAIAVCYLHAYRNPVHEQRTAEIIKARIPDASISLSHQVNPEPREYERASTTVLDAYVKPTVKDYIASLERELERRSVPARLEIMLSNGGSTTAATARDYPIQIIESGPAAGVEAAIWACKELAIANALSFDMGGTTAKLCLINEFAAARSRKFEAGRVHRFVAGSGLPVLVPVYDLVEIGAGGGSIARIDKLGLISVGPDSAGASPGPACYGLGGTHPTVTDADLMLGLLDADYFLGGEMRLDRQAAERTLTTRVAEPLKFSAVEAAYGVFDIVNETMAAAARIHIAEKGADPRALSIIAFGGAGPLHALEIARKLGCPRVIFPPLAGLMSSFGLLTSPAAFERLAMVKRVLSQITVAEIKAIIETLSAEIAAILGGKRDDITFSCVAEMWHKGQEYPFEVPFSLGELESSGLAELGKRFRGLYQDLYGRSDEEMDIEIATVRVIGQRAKQRATRIVPGEKQDQLPASQRKVHNARTRSFENVLVVSRASLRPGETLAGPLVVQERKSGVVIGRGDTISGHASGALIVEIGE